MTAIHKSPGQRRRLDVAGLLLTVVGVLFGALAFILITYEDANALVMVPAIVAATIGATHLTKREAKRR